MGQGMTRCHDFEHDGTYKNDTKPSDIQYN